MLFYMQMRNWYLIFLMLTIAYMIQQKASASNSARSFALHNNASIVSIIR